LDPEHARIVTGWPASLRIEIRGSGEVLFCHATPQSDTDIITRLTRDDRVASIFGGLNLAFVVCGHTHMQFDRTIGTTRVLNAGSVGMPYGAPGAYWLLLGTEIGFRHTPYHLMNAADRIRATKYPQAQDFAGRSVLQPPSEEEMLHALARVDSR
jgi:predicted phosphodiesterase